MRSAPLLEQWDELATNAILATMPTRRTSFDKAGLVSRYLVEQNGKGALPVRRLISALDKGLDDQLRLVEALPTAIGNNERLLVPDTNAILFRPDLEAWQLDGAWTIVIVPQVTRELDERKDHPKLGERARAFNGRLEDYERRGDTFVGVPLSGLLTVREVPIEADVSLAPKWLRAGHPDDRILASALELSWRDLTATVAIATRDRAMRNKARFSRLATVNVETL